VQTSQSAGDFTFQYMSEEWAPKVEAMSGGELKLELLPAGSVVPYRETIDAVANGILDGDLTAVSYFSGRDPVFAVIGDLIAGYDTVDQVQGFCEHGGGKEVLQKAMDEVTGGDVHVVGCGPYAKEALVSKVPIRTVEDFEGVKIRSPEGLAAEVFRRAGASPVALPFSEVFTSLEKGIVDAADASAYVNNTQTGMHEIAKYPLYPGIHSMAVLQFTINQDTWDGLTDAQRAILDVWYDAAYNDLRRYADMKDQETVQKDKAGEGTKDIEVIDWPQEERDKFRQIAIGAWQDFAQQSELAREAYEAHVGYMMQIGLLSREEGEAALQGEG
ncbi:MAG: TRAP transporter substrate-binding protein, partial [Geminicoccaceae bacterium]|nr:TRAP transporter substrate-binding protein [Geminicoccaceae bacterium]